MSNDFTREGGLMELTVTVSDALRIAPVGEYDKCYTVLRLLRQQFPPTDSGRLAFLENVNTALVQMRLEPK